MVKCKLLIFVKVSKILLKVTHHTVFTLIFNALQTYQNLPLFIAILPFSATFLSLPFITILASRTYKMVKKPFKTSHLKMIDMGKIFLTNF